MKKHISILLFLCFLVVAAFGQSFTIHPSPEEKAETLLARISKSERFETEYRSASVYWMANPSSSAGYANGEITHDLWILVSEFDEAPRTNLVRLSSFYNPSIINWIKDSETHPVMVIEYGPADKRSQASLQISLDGIHKIQ